MIQLHPKQSDLYRDMFQHGLHRFTLAVCCRGFGKSYFAATAAVTAVAELEALPADVPNKNVYICAPTFDQVIDIYYSLLAYTFQLEDLATTCSRQTGRFAFKNNTELRLISYESIERCRGKGIYMFIWDELSSCTKGIDPKSAWEGIIQPCIVTRWSPEQAVRFGAPSPGRAIILSTAKGYNFLHELSTYADEDPAWKTYVFDYNDTPLLDKDEIERLRHTIDPIEFASEYLSLFKESGFTVFYCFDRNRNVVKVDDFQEKEDVHVAIDFNVGLQCSSAFAIRGGQIHINQEFKGCPNTESLAKLLTEEFKGHTIYAYPDPSGRARKTSAPVGITDFRILQEHGIIVQAKSAAPSIKDSASAVNRMLLNAAGESNMFVHPRCKGVIKSLERTAWAGNNPNTMTIDKSMGVEHYSDGLRYATDYLFPVIYNKRVTAKGNTF